MRKRPVSLYHFGIFIFIGYALFADLIDERFGSLRVVLWFLTLSVMFFSAKKGNGLKFKNISVLAAVPVLFFLLFNSKGLQGGSYMATVKFLYFWAVAFIIAQRPDSLYKIVKYIAILGFTHVFATYFFFFVPSLYRIMFSVWKYWPTGTGNGAYGYRAALSNHYSGNGMMLALTYLAFFSVLMSQKSGLLKHKKQDRNFTVFLISFFAVILTTKRAHLLFGVMSMSFMYFICNPKKIYSRGFKLLLLGLVLGPIAYFMASQVGVIGDSLSRFKGMTEDGSVLSRYSLWAVAWDMFKRSPIIGNGWSSFRYTLNDSYLGRTYGYMNAHNVYLQLLAEVGIIGFTLYMAILIYLVWNSLRLLRICVKKEIQDYSLVLPLFFSGALLVFYSLYSMTGNCLYDKMQPFYFLAGGIVIGCKRKMKQLHLL